MINSFFANWPDEITLTAFIEKSSGLDDRAVKPKIIIKDFYEHVPKYKYFVEKFKDKEKHHCRAQIIPCIVYCNPNYFNFAVHF